MSSELNLSSRRPGIPVRQIEPERAEEIFNFGSDS